MCNGGYAWDAVEKTDALLPVVTIELILLHSVTMRMLHQT